jgi:hypothetical protein
VTMILQDKLRRGYVLRLLVPQGISGDRDL